MERLLKFTNQSHTVCSAAGLERKRNNTQKLSRLRTIYLGMFMKMFCGSRLLSWILHFTRALFEYLKNVKKWMRKGRD